jgi:hypothetical protein
LLQIARRLLAKAKLENPALRPDNQRSANTSLNVRD